jgi:hypothetical protein
MNEYIAYCGLDCEACEARLATVNNDNELRQRVAREWSELNDVEITAEMINCSVPHASGGHSGQLHLPRELHPDHRCLHCSDCMDGSKRL